MCLKNEKLVFVYEMSRLLTLIIITYMNTMH
ncbi:hypothetical protein DFQ01_12148 [Paenibacillus cellulosilyticus]|uniref:Uncharacterized protein n=1 Tax=Paenibacillus cellulosilyticus TaxID=375489 RepID=A0A2V2YNZ8_9BACL|nr:hypothetical protein DFQ01_12148 [Paenibacillus cellulosilyticus]